MYSNPYVNTLGALRSQVGSAGIKPLGAFACHTKWQWSPAPVRGSTDIVQSECERLHRHPSIIISRPYHHHRISFQKKDIPSPRKGVILQNLEAFLRDSVHYSGGKEVRLVYRPKPDPAPHRKHSRPHGVKPQRCIEVPRSPPQPVPARPGTKISFESIESTS